MVNNRPGRPLGTATARQRLIDAAQRHFAAGDLAVRSSRELAREVGVSHTLVNYHFGSRDGLVAAAVTSGAAPHDVVALSRAGGKIDLSRLAHGILAAWEHPEHGARLAGLARLLSAGDGTSRVIHAYLQNSVFQPLVHDFGRERARRMAAAIVGFLFGRYVLALPMFTTMPREEAGRLLLSMIR
jgi:AcrR family transcriptional regulator